MDVLLIIAALEKRLNELSHGALQRPVEKNEFEYGQVVGNYHGLLQAIQEVRRLMADDEDED